MKLARKMHPIFSTVCLLSCLLQAVDSTGPLPMDACEPSKFKNKNNENKKSPIKKAQYKNGVFKGDPHPDAYIDQTNGPNAVKYNANWMKNMNDNIWLSRISIPGTHNSPATVGGARNLFLCQTWPIWQQLQAGIRFLDVQLTYKHESGQKWFAIYNKIATGANMFQNKNFSNILKDCKEWLAEHPSEVILMMLSKTGQTSDTDMKTLFDEKYLSGTYGEIIFRNNSNVKLGAVRGKIVLIAGISDFPGIDGSHPRFSGCSKYHYSAADGLGSTCGNKDGDKSAKNKNSLESAATYYNNRWEHFENPFIPPASEWTYYNIEKFFITWTNTYAYDCSFEGFARLVNKATYEFFVQRNNQYYANYGIVVMNFPAPILIDEIIKYNKRTWNFTEFGDISSGNNVTIKNVQHNENLYALNEVGMRRTVRTILATNVKYCDQHWIEMASKTEDNVVVLLNDCYQEFLYEVSKKESDGRDIFTWRAPGYMHPSLKWKKRLVNGNTYIFENKYYPGEIMCAMGLDQGDATPYKRIVKATKKLGENDPKCHWQVNPA